jgi:hypothetical protein
VEAKVANFDKSSKHSSTTSFMYSSKEKKNKEEIIVTRCQIWAVAWLFNLYKAALDDYFTDLVNSAIVTKQHNLLTVIRVVRLLPFVSIQSVRFLPYPKTPSPSAFLRFWLFWRWRTLARILVLWVDPRDTSTFPHLL